MADNKLVQALGLLVEALEERSSELKPCERIELLSEAEVEAFKRLYPLLYVRVNRTFGNMYVSLHY